MYKFNGFYFLFSLLLLATEIVIGAFAHDSLIRPYGGDFLVVILLYCLLRSFWTLPVIPTALGVLFFSYTIETLQYFGLADKLGFTKPSLMRTVLGSYFTWTDILSYTLGIITVLAIERLLLLKREGKRTKFINV
jgi:hypothetical protein